MRDTIGEESPNSLVTFYHGPLLMDVPLLISSLAQGNFFMGDTVYDS